MGALTSLLDERLVQRNLGNGIRGNRILGNDLESATVDTEGAVRSGPATAETRGAPVSIFASDIETFGIAIEIAKAVRID